MIDSKVSDPKVNSTRTAAAAGLPQQRTESRQALQASPVDSGSESGPEVSTEEIAALAYQFWIERGSPHGSHEEDWYRAEEQLRGAKPLGKSASA